MLITKVGVPNYSHLKISQLVASLQTSHQQVVLRQLVTSCQTCYPITPHIGALHLKAHALISEYRHMLLRDVPDPDSTIRYPVKCRHPILSGIRVKFPGYLSNSTVTYFITNIKWKT